MLRDLIDRFAYRYRLWVGESQGDRAGAGESPQAISSKSESVWALIARMLQILIGGLILLWFAYRFAMRTFPSFSDGIPLFFIFLGAVWCGVGLFITGGELLSKNSKSDGNSDQSI
jgi:hypothetical protein